MRLEGRPSWCCHPSETAAARPSSRMRSENNSDRLPPSSSPSSRRSRARPPRSRTPDDRDHQQPARHRGEALVALFFRLVTDERRPCCASLSRACRSVRPAAPRRARRPECRARAPIRGADSGRCCPQGPSIVPTMPPHRRARAVGSSTVLIASTSRAVEIETHAAGRVLDEALTKAHVGIDRGLARLAFVFALRSRS